jgi:transcriptional regulator with XRE-family HTH domain
MNLRRTVGRNIRKLREQKCWSQEELAEHTGLHRTYISGVERGVRNPTLDVLEVFAKALGVSASLLLVDM